MTVNNLAVLERDDGNLDRAAALFRRALASFVRTLGARHPHAVLALANRRAVAGRSPQLAERAVRREHRPIRPQETQANPPMR